MNRRQAKFCLQLRFAGGVYPLSACLSIVTGPNAPAWDYLRLYVSTDNANWTQYQSLITPASYGGTMV